MKTTLYTLGLCLLAYPALAEKAPSVMFQPPEQTISGTPPLETSSEGDHCEKLLQKVERLKGKPQRKHSMLERYELECGKPQ